MTVASVASLIRAGLGLLAGRPFAMIERALLVRDDMGRDAAEQGSAGPLCA